LRVPGAFAETGVDRGRVVTEFGRGTDHDGGVLGLSGVEVGTRGDLAKALRRRLSLKRLRTARAALSASPSRFPSIPPDSPLDPPDSPRQPMAAVTTALPNRSGAHLKLPARWPAACRTAAVHCVPARSRTADPPSRRCRTGRPPDLPEPVASST